MKSGEPRTVLPFGQHALEVTRPPPGESRGDWPQQGTGGPAEFRVTLGSSPASQQTLAGLLLTSEEPRRTIPLACKSQEDQIGVMVEPEDFRRDFLPRFIEAQRAFHDGDPEPNLALWSTEDPVTLFAARGLVDSGTEPVTETFRFVASTFSDVGTFDWETLASGVAGDFAYTAAVERYTNSREGGPPEGPSSGRPMCTAARAGTGERFTAMPIAGLLAMT